MDRPTYDCIEFDGFILNPKDRLLFRGEQRIELKGRDFDVLVYLANRPNFFVTNEELINGVWGSDTNIEEGNVTNHINKIRNALDDTDLKHPKYVETVHGRKGYRFIARVQRVPCFSDESQEPQTNSRIASHPAVTTEGTFQVESHKFVPIFLGLNCYRQIRSEPQQTLWAEYKQIAVEEGTLNVLPTGVGVWHMQDTLDFSTLTDLAIWRRKTYHEITEEQHIIHDRTQEILSSLRSHKDDPFLLRGRPGYVLSLMVLREPLWDSPEELRTALKLLSCLTPLQSNDSDKEAREHAIRLETEFFKSGFPHPDIVEFGLSGSNIGFASWAGVSYHELSDQHLNLRDRIIEFEIAVQALWWFSSCVKQTCLSMNPKSKSELQDQIEVMVRQFARLKTIGATEPTPQRTMCEAILATSRLESLLDDTIKLYNQL